MAKRKRMSRSKSRNDFKRKSGSHPRNGTFAAMRGGIRL